MTVKIRRVYADVPLPSCAHPGDAGIDFASANDYRLRPGETKLIDTGLQIETPKGYFLSIVPRSGLATKSWLVLVNAPGTVDTAPYRNNIYLPMRNLGSDDIEISRGQRIAQGIFLKYETVKFQEVKQFSKTTRGKRGFGSSGR